MTQSAAFEPPALRNFIVERRAGFRLNVRDATQLASVLGDIAKEIGPPGEVPTKVWLQTLVDQARPADSPIHHKFIWDDAEAGEKYRLQQAAYYIRAFDFQYVDKRGSKSPKVRWLPTIELTRGEPHGQRAPITMPDALSNQQAIDSLVDTALREMQSWIRRYEALERVAKLAPIFRVARKVLAKSEAKKKKKKKKRRAKRAGKRR